MGTVAVRLDGDRSTIGMVGETPFRQAKDRSQP
jgi:hypothetical protein